MTTRIRRTFWVLLVVAVAATGALSRALGAAPGPGAGVTVALSGLVLTASAGLALRILVVVGRPDPATGRAAAANRGTNMGDRSPEWP